MYAYHPEFDTATYLFQNLYKLGLQKERIEMKIYRDIDPTVKLYVLSDIEKKLTT
jgi:hypothetical protein